jgi:hypothetical protein
VHVKKGDQKIEGTIISKSDSEIVVSERGKFGAPQLHVISTKAEGVTVAPTKTKKITYRNDTSQFVDPFRQRTLIDESERAAHRNQVDFSVRGYDVKKDEVYIEGSLNGGSPFGKWVSAKDFMPLVDGQERMKVGSIDDVVRQFARTIGQEGALKAPAPKEEEKEEKPAEPEAKTEDPISAASDTAGADSSDTEVSRAAHEEDLAEQLKRTTPQPLAETGTPINTAPEKKNTARPDLKDTETYVEERLEALRGKKATGAPEGTSASRTTSEVLSRSQNSAPTTAQAARSGVVLSDVAFTSGAAVPALVLAYATPQSGQFINAGTPAWSQAVAQFQTLTGELTTRLSERRAQYEVLSMAGAGESLLAQSRDRINILEKASAELDQTMTSAQTRRSAIELGRFQGSATKSTSGGDPLTNARSIQSTLDQLRSQSGSGGSISGGETSISIALPGAAGLEVIQQLTTADMGAGILGAIEQEMRFEQDVQAKLVERLRALQGEARDLRAQAEQTLREGATVQADIADRLSETEALLSTLEQAQKAQTERVANATQALNQTQRALKQVAPEGYRDRASRNDGSQSALRSLDTRGSTPGSSAVAAAGATAGGAGGTPTPAPIRQGATPPPVPKLTGGGALSPRATASKASSGLPGRPQGSSAPLRPLSNLPLGGAASEVATLERDRQRDERGGGFGPNKNRGVMDLPQKRWDNADEDGEDTDGDYVDTDDSTRGATNDANDYLDQFQSGDGDDGESIGSGYGGGEESDGDNAFADSNSFVKRSLGAAAAGEPLPSGAQAGVLGDIENFKMMAAGRAQMAKSQALRARNSASAAKIANAKKKRMEALEEEMATKAEDIIELGAFEAIVPVLKYIGRVFISAANRNAGFMSMKILPGYRPSLPQGVEPDHLEKQWDILLAFEIFIILFGAFASFMVSLGIALAFFFYLFGPVLGVISVFCSYFGGACRAAVQAVAG